MIINRRALMGAIAVLPAAPAAAAIETALPASAEDRLRMGLAMAAKAMHELVSEPGSRWWINFRGDAPSGLASFDVMRFDLMQDPDPHPLLPDYKIEKSANVMEGSL